MHLRLHQDLIFGFNLPTYPAVYSRILVISCCQLVIKGDLTWTSTLSLYRTRLSMLTPTEKMSLKTPDMLGPSLDKPVSKTRYPRPSYIILNESISKLMQCVSYSRFNITFCSISSCYTGSTSVRL